MTLSVRLTVSWLVGRAVGRLLVGWSVSKNCVKGVKFNFYVPIGKLTVTIFLPLSPQPWAGICLQQVTN